MAPKRSKKAIEEEMRRQEEERKKKEEEDRIKAEEDKKRKEEEERLRQEMLEKMRAEEAARLEEEAPRVMEADRDRQQHLEEQQRAKKQQKEWVRFQQCYSLPDPRNESDLTAFLTIWREEEGYGGVEGLKGGAVVKSPMTCALEKCVYAEEVVSDILREWCRAAEGGLTPRQQFCLKYINEIRTVELDTIDDATAHLLAHIENEPSNGRNEVQNAWPTQKGLLVGFWGYLQSKGFRAKVIDFPSIGIGMELPKSIALQAMGHCIGVRVFYTSYDSVAFLSPSHSEVVLGGMVHVDLLSIPHFPKKIKGWTVRSVPPPEEAMKKLSYPNTDATTPASGSIQPVKIEYTIPSNVIVREPNVQLWDSQALTWCDDNIGEIAFDESTRKCSFFSLRLASFALTQDRTLDLPYSWWQIKARSATSAQLLLQGPDFLIAFAITEDGVQLEGPDRPELAALREQILSPADLLLQLRNCGINCLPNDHDAELLARRLSRPTHTENGENESKEGEAEGDHEDAEDETSPAAKEKNGNNQQQEQQPEQSKDAVNGAEGGGETVDGSHEGDSGPGQPRNGHVSVKDVGVEAKAYWDLSGIACCFDIASSRHNKKTQSDTLLVRVHDNVYHEDFDANDLDFETDWTPVMFWHNKSSLACAVESEEESADACTIPEGSVTHASLRLTLEEAGKIADAMRLRLDSPQTARFAEMTRQLMMLLRLCSFG
ncbi:unnamed protein product [Vitrella brassicaformis CCMP3155]|uniref:IC97/Casc1 N-terminal domain-containing protein n=2 Tax=Vitrella brassicaformis TaxID=1169539 RepID=A0A0G4EEQ6_VITBC|nr:unnamed protein product [Vitrella brassicaformis CCMP3155]|eukprot:CEL93882.1 unnamed protein product [Vitrella brassicaformis CCMP3155]